MSTSRGTWRRRSPSSSAVLLLAVLVVAGCGSGQSAGKDERAGLAFERVAKSTPTGDKWAVWVADADGSNPRQVTEEGWNEDLSSDGRWLAYAVPDKDWQATGNLHWTTFVKDLSSEKSTSLGELNVLSWSPTEDKIAGIAKGRLVLVEIPSGQQQELARGNIGQAKFSPDGKELVFSRGNGQEAPKWRSDLFSVRLSDGSTTQLTKDGHSDLPVWGADWIAFRRFHYSGTWPIGAIYLMRPDGTDQHELARGKESPTPSFLGLDPLDFSDDGTRLLGCAASEFYCHPVAFTVPGGKSHEINVGDEGDVIQAGEISADGSEVLVAGGGFDDEAHHSVYVVPLSGSPARVVARNSSSPTWAD